MPAKAELKGFKECREALQDMPEMIQRLTVRGPLIEAARTIHKEVESRAPVSARPSNPTPGSLKAGGRARRHRRGRGSLDTVAVQFTDPAAVPNEYGTTKMAAQPYFRPAVDAVEAEVMARFGESLKQAVDKAARDLAEASRLAAK
jgi:HK97 gp10 family phage protein